MNQCLLAIVIAPESEDTLIDWLLSRADVNGFTSSRVNGHGSLGELTLAEQVTGRGLYYWLMPVMETGELG